MLQFDAQHIDKAIDKYKKDIDNLLQQASDEGKKVTSNKAKIMALEIENEKLEQSNRDINKKLDTIDGIIKGLEGLKAGELPSV